MMKKTKRMLVFLSMVPLIFSCEGNTDRKRIVANNSDMEITVQASGELFGSIDKKIEAGESEVICIISQRGGSSFIENPSNGINSFLITNSAGDTCKKDYSVESNWTTSAEETKKLPSNWEHEYVLTIKPEDF